MSTSLLDEIVVSLVILLVGGPSAAILAAAASGMDPRMPWHARKIQFVATISVIILLSVVAFGVIISPIPNADQGLVAILPPATVSARPVTGQIVDPRKPRIEALTRTTTPTRITIATVTPQSTTGNGVSQAATLVAPTKTAPPPPSAVPPTPYPDVIPLLLPQCFKGHLSITKIQPSSSAISLRKDEDIVIYGAAHSVPGGRSLERFVVEAIVGAGESRPVNNPVTPWQFTVGELPLYLTQDSRLATWRYEEWQKLFKSRPPGEYQPSSLTVWFRVRGFSRDGNAETTDDVCLVSVVLYQ